MKTWEEKLEPCGPCQRCLVEGMLLEDAVFGGAIGEDLERRLTEAGPCTCARPPETTDQDELHQESLAELAMFGWS